MEIKQFNEEIEFSDKVTTKLILETSSTKEIRILLREGLVMKEHKAPFPIIVHVLEGSIDFGVEGKKNRMEKGAIISLKKNVTHDLSANKNSIIRLTLCKSDNIERVEEVIK